MTRVCNHRAGCGLWPLASFPSPSHTHRTSALLLDGKAPSLCADVACDVHLLVERYWGRSHLSAPANPTLNTACMFPSQFYFFPINVFPWKRLRIDNNSQSWRTMFFLKRMGMQRKIGRYLQLAALLSATMKCLATSNLRARKMAQREKALAAISDDLSVPGTRTVEGEN